VFNATFSNISAISWRPVLVVEEAGVPGENHRPWASNWQTLSLAAASRVHPFCHLQSRARTHAVLVIGLNEFVIQLPNSLSHPDPVSARSRLDVYVVFIISSSIGYILSTLSPSFELFSERTPSINRNMMLNARANFISLLKKPMHEGCYIQIKEQNIRRIMYVRKKLEGKILKNRNRQNNHGETIYHRKLKKTKQKKNKTNRN
jgi:hypothetical protein